MIFTSFSFLCIFPIIFIIYYLVCYFSKSYYSSKIGNYTLLVVSYLLYISTEPSYALILLWVTSVTYFGALLIRKKYIFSNRWVITILVILTLFPLLFFKYTRFICESFISIFGIISEDATLDGLNWIIPIGISFFTFQALGYLWDVYRRQIEPEKNWWSYMLFVSFFPQIASGPISYASELLPQINEKRQFEYKHAVQGLKLLLWGTFIKTVVADRLGIYIDTIYDNYLFYSGLTNFVASVFYSIQIYSDFAGYSLMAIGIGKLLGFNLVNNFNHPYLAVSITDFWHRWHISLTRWLTKYVYIPLGGSRCSKFRCYWNIFITFIISGLWHGANWTFVIWGSIHGVLQIGEKALGLQKLSIQNAVIAVFRSLLTFCLVNFAWIFFRMPTLHDAISMIEHMFSTPGTLFVDNKINMIIIMLSILTMYIKDICEEMNSNFTLFSNRHLIIRWTSYVLVALSIIMFGILDASNFIYVNF